jgi:hypothetical protein
MITKTNLQAPLVAHRVSAGLASTVASDAAEDRVALPMDAVAGARSVALDLGGFDFCNTTVVAGSTVRLNPWFLQTKDIPVTSAASKAMSANQGSDGTLERTRHRLELSTDLKGAVSTVIRRI